jgi:hypothetical protein
MSAAPPVLRFFKKKVLEAELNKPTVSSKSPFQSPASGNHPIPPDGPNPKVTSAAPPAFVFFKKNALAEGL